MLLKMTTKMIILNYDKLDDITETRFNHLYTTNLYTYTPIKTLNISIR